MQIAVTQPASLRPKRIRLIAQGYAYSKDLSYKMEADIWQLAQGANNGTGADCLTPI